MRRRQVDQKEKQAIPFPEELDHLDEISARLDVALREAETGVGRVDKEYMDTKRYMVQNRGEIDPHEMFQNELALKQIDRTGAFAVEKRQRLARLKDSPYFARIDFRYTGEPDPEVYYIGPASFSDDSELLICDWRSPIAGMFYDCEAGPAGYDAPYGRIEGGLTRKRQFKIKSGKMEYALESSVNIQDDVLQRELSHTSDEKMKSIIATIQKEQNKIIRNERARTMIIQGVAGSGKTSIALHRMAFLLYRFKDQLSARNITILSPNKVFGDYISSVLPELGEEPIYEMSFEDIAREQLEGLFEFEQETDFSEAEDNERSERIRYKSTMAFVRQMALYLQQIPDNFFNPVDYVFGRFIAEADWIGEMFRNYGAYPVKTRLKMMAEIIYERFESGNFMGEDLPKPGAILKSLTAMLRVKNSLALYKAFYKWAGMPHLFVMSEKKTLEWADIYPFLYFRAAFEGLKEDKMTRHLVIDEMQDYTPIQYVVINHLYDCPKTILGDFGQFIHPCHLNTLEDMSQLYEDAEMIELNKSYRSTCEIIQFAKKIGGIESLEPMERHGKPPELFRCGDRQEEIRHIRSRIKDFKESGHASLGIIMKTNLAAAVLYEQLSEEQEIYLVTPESSCFKNGVTITSVRLSKGLEFDAVVIPDADRETYHTEYDRSLLYIACTRAMHQLALLYTGEMSPLIRG